MMSTGHHPRLWTAAEDAFLCQAVATARPPSARDLAAQMAAWGWSRTRDTVIKRLRVLHFTGALSERPVVAAQETRENRGKPAAPTPADLDAHRRLIQLVIDRVFSHGASR